MQLLHGNAEAVQAVYHVVHDCVMQACQLQCAAMPKGSRVDTVSSALPPSEQLASSDIVKGPSLAVDGGVHRLW